MRYLGIDYGLRRIGFAIADEDVRVAVPRGAVLRTDDAQAIGELLSLARKERIEKIIVGLPMGLDGRETEISSSVRVFGDELGVESGLPVEFENEALTTRMAAASGASGEHKDQSAAAIILQSYLDKENAKRKNEK